MTNNDKLQELLEELTIKENKYKVEKALLENPAKVGAMYGLNDGTNTEYELAKKAWEEAAVKVETFRKKQLNPKDLYIH